MALSDGPADGGCAGQEEGGREDTETTPWGSVGESPGLDALSTHCSFIHAFLSSFPPLILQQKVIYAICTPMFIEALVTFAKGGNNPRIH